MNISIATFLIMILLSGGCATAPEVKKRETRLADAMLAKDVIKGVTGAVPVEMTGTFTTEDPQVVTWIRLEEVVGIHTIRWDWYNPDGRLYSTTGNYQVNRDGKYRPSQASWHRIAISGEKAASFPGRWEVRVFLDDKPVASREFEIREAFDLHRYISRGPKTKVKPDRKKWALIIGIERYKKAVPVSYAERDARSIRDYLMNFLGVPEENTITLINEMATKAEVDVLIKDRLKGLIGEGDTLYVYYSGHGIPSDETPYLLPYDGDPESPRITAYPVDDLYKDLDQLPARDVFVFMDTCFSGRIGREERESILIAGARPGILKVRDPLLLSRKIIVVAAAKANQLSNFYKEKEHGLFTYYLLNGLIGDADKNADRKVQLGELSSYAGREGGSEHCRCSQVVLR
ncbi:MAG: caspase family protein [Deltaproteobacteria bacterium]|nr:caspase family protein [Deltaproteobacteria bacterium]